MKPFLSFILALYFLGPLFHLPPLTTLLTSTIFAAVSIAGNQLVSAPSSAVEAPAAKNKVAAQAKAAATDDMGIDDDLQAWLDNLRRIYMSSLLLQTRRRKQLGIPEVKQFLVKMTDNEVFRAILVIASGNLSPCANKALLGERILTVRSLRNTVRRHVD